MSNNIFTEFMNDIGRYLESRFSDVPEHELQETAAYIANRVIALSCDMMLDRDREWKRSLNKSGVKAAICYERPEESETEAVG